MKEIERVSLGGYAFTFNDDAARLTEEYLGELEKYYDCRPGGGEILDGIEERMAELLMEKAGRDGVVSLPMIEEIIGVLGRPEVIEAAGEEIPGQARNDEGTRSGRKPKRKLYRDLSDKVVAGVCSGLAAYFRTDVALFRILFVVFTVAFAFGFRLPGIGWRISMFAPLLYLILWICMPAAKTVRQRWEQRGEDGTLDSIKRSIESGAREVDSALRSVGQSKAWSSIGGVIEKFIGVILLIVGFAGLFSGSIGIFGSGALKRSGWMNGSQGFLGLGQLYSKGMWELYEVAPGLTDALTQPWVQGVLLLVIFLPFLGILYGALQLLFGFKSPKWRPGLVIFVLWLMSIIAAGILIVFARGMMITI